LTGEGLRPLAPPLVNSDWVLGPDSRVIRIALNGVAGPIQVNGLLYQPPDVLPEMPALGVLEDVQIAAVLNYIRRDWGHEAPTVSPARVAAIRSEHGDRERPWSAEELLRFE
jgi:mono/diheme cytochrome c family protein